MIREGETVYVEELFEECAASAGICGAARIELKRKRDGFWKYNTDEK